MTGWYYYFQSSHDAPDKDGLCHTARLIISQYWSIFVFIKSDATITTMWCLGTGQWWAPLVINSIQQILPYPQSRLIYCNRYMYICILYVILNYAVLQAAVWRSDRRLAVVVTVDLQSKLAGYRGAVFSHGLVLLPFHRFISVTMTTLCGAVPSSPLAHQQHQHHVWSSDYQNIILSRLIIFVYIIN